MSTLNYKTIAILCLGCCALSHSDLKAEDYAQPLSPVKPLNYNNPLSSIFMCADPTSVEYDGRLYVYGSNDQQEYDGRGPGSNNTYGLIKSLVVLSTADMINWTHHGTIDMASVCGSWMGNSWAPSIVSREEEDGLTHFYMYFSNGGGSVGVVTSTSPVGPWESPLNHTLANGGTPGVAPCCWPFDPGVVIDEQGVGWLALGGGDAQNDNFLHPGNARIAKLAPDMISFDGEFKPIDAPYQFEASELNIIGGKYVYIYCTSWSNRNDWSSYGSSKPAPSTCSMCYMVSDNPLNPDSWTYGGEILKNPGAFGYPWGNNHTHLHKFNGKYYMLYHTQVMENIAGIGGAYRSIGVNEAKVDEDNVTISPITMTNSGAKFITENRINALELQEAETMSNGTGFKVTRYKAYGNCVLYNIEPGAWTCVTKAGFGEGANQFTAKIRGKGRLEVRIDDLYSDPVGILDFDNSSIKELTIQLQQTIKGNHNIYFVFASANNSTRFDNWQFSYSDPGSVIDSEVQKPIVKEEYFQPSGVKVDNPSEGIYIRRTTYADGQVHTAKVVLK